jgi:hypothetical protein
MVGCFEQDLLVNNENMKNATELQRIVIDLDKEADSRVGLSQ